MKLTEKEKQLFILIVKKLKEYTDKKINKVIKEEVRKEVKKQLLIEKKKRKKSPLIAESNKITKRAQKKVSKRLSKDNSLNEALMHTLQSGQSIETSAKPVDRLANNMKKHKQAMNEAYFNSNNIESDDYDPFGITEEITTYTPQKQSSDQIVEEVETHVPKQQNEYDELFDGVIKVNENATSISPHDEVSLNDMNVLLQGKNMSIFAKKHPGSSGMKVTH